MRGEEKPWRKTLEFVFQNQTKYPLYPKQIKNMHFVSLGYDYLRTLFGSGEETKLSYILTLSYKYQFISLSISAVQDDQNALSSNTCNPDMAQIYNISMKETNPTVLGTKRNQWFILCIRKRLCELEKFQVYKRALKIPNKLC